MARLINCKTRWGLQNSFCLEVHLSFTPVQDKLVIACRADSITWDMVAKEAETGKAYLHEHKDVHGQPVIVIRSSLHVTGINLMPPF